MSRGNFCGRLSTLHEHSCRSAPADITSIRRMFKITFRDQITGPGCDPTRLLFINTSNISAGKYRYRFPERDKSALEAIFKQCKEEEEGQFLTRSFSDGKS